MSHPIQLAVLLVTLLVGSSTAAVAQTWEPVSATLDPAEVALLSTETQRPSAARGAHDWIELLNEDFEGSFPGTTWTVVRSGSAVDATWGVTNHRQASGTYSAYPAMNGAAGVPAPGPYPHNMSTWMIAGPFDLSDADEAVLQFQVWRNTENGWDFLDTFVSVNGTNYFGWARSGVATSWAEAQHDLRAVPTLGDVTGQPQVWIAFRFRSDESINAEGVYVDDVVLRMKEVLPPQVSITPASLQYELAIDASETQSVTVGNTGIGDLTWNLVPASSQEPGAPAGTVAAGGLIEDSYAHGSGPTGMAATTPEFAELHSRAQLGEQVPVIVELAVPFTPEGALADIGASVQRSRIASVQQEILTVLPARGAVGLKEFSTIPYLAMHADVAALEALANHPLVVRIFADELSAPGHAESSVLIGAPNAWAQGYEGAGFAVAVLDTGVEAGHAFFGGRIVEEACYSTNGGGAHPSTSLCPTGGNQQIGSGAAEPSECTGVDGCSHGTHVAGSVAGSGTDGSVGFSGVAPRADIIALQVFSKFTSNDTCSNGAPCVLSYTSDQMLALERVLELSNSRQIAAANMSLGGGRHTTHCDGDPLKPIIDNLLLAGIATVISSGNNGYTDSVGSPGCISTAVTVGSTQDGSEGTVADAISSFSNSASIVDLLAPGQWITSAVIGGGYSTWQGTSMAAPHVAGAFALLRSRRASLSVPAALAVLQQTGVAVTDHRNGLTMSRIQVDAAIGGLGWLATALSSGTVSPGGQTEIDITADAGGLAPGTYMGELTLTSNDSDQPSITVPVSLTVTGSLAQITVILQGAHSGGSGMSTQLNSGGYLPSGQPYGGAAFDDTPLQYDGTEAADQMPSNVVDWVLVELRSVPLSGLPKAADVVTRRAALLLEDGSIVDPVSGGALRLPVAPGEYFVVVRHRNHIPVMSAALVDGVSGLLEHDFTTGLSQATGTTALVGLGPGGSAPFGLWAGDMDGDGQVTAPDFNLFLSATTTGATGYLMADLDMDGQVTAPDFNLFLLGTQAGAASQVPED